MPMRPVGKSLSSFAKDRKDVVLAFCRTHVRRDFLDTANGFSELEARAMAWVDSIGEIFHLNNQRVKHEIDSAEFAKADQSLREALDAMKQQFESELTEAYLHPERAKRLNSLREHREGLMVFVDHPRIPMDNSEAERRMRIAALGRKNYYGSGSVASGHFTACLFGTSVRFQVHRVQTLYPAVMQVCAGKGDPELFSSAGQQNQDYMVHRAVQDWTSPLSGAEVVGLQGCQRNHGIH